MLKHFSQAQKMNLIIISLIGIYSIVNYPDFTINILFTLGLALGFQFIPNKNKPLKWIFAGLFLLSSGILAFELWGK